MIAPILPKLKLKFETGATTHVGKVREVNEDSYIVRPELGLWAVADGVGGHEAGQIASQTVTNTLASLGPSVSAADQLARFQERILRSNDRIKDVIAERQGGIMGTTVAAILIYETHFNCVWSGDSRAYRIRDGAIEQISRDHSEVQEMIDGGLLKSEEAGSWPRRNVITRAIGIFDDPDLEVVEGEIEADDTFLLCSDGLTEHVTNGEIGDLVSRNRSQDACDALIDLALERGGSDNVSVIVIRCHRAEPTNFVPGNPPGEVRAQT